MGLPKRHVACYSERGCGSRKHPFRYPTKCLHQPGAVSPLFQPLQTYCTGYTLALVKEKTLSKELLSLKAKTSWSWERMCRELHRVMGEEGPSHTTLFRYASGRVKRPNVLVEQYVREAIQKLTVELSQKQNRQA